MSVDITWLAVVYVMIVIVAGLFLHRRITRQSVDRDFAFQEVADAIRDAHEPGRGSN